MEKKIYKIAFFDVKRYDRHSFDRYKDEYNLEIKYFKYKLNEDTVLLAKGYDAVCAFVNDTLNKEVINKLEESGVKLLLMRCAGYNNVDLEAASGKITVLRVPAYSPYAVAEHAFSLMLTLNRKTHLAYNRVKTNNFSVVGLTGFDFNGKTIGIIGMGRIGRIVAKIAIGFGMNVLGYDKYPTEMEGVEYTDLDTIYQKSDIVTLHCPLFDENYHMIDKKAIDKMKDGVMIINISRGGLINTPDLIEGIKTGKIGAAGLDVYEEEKEYFYADYSEKIIEDDVLARLISFNNVILTSHQAFLTYDALTNIAEVTLQNAEDFFNDKVLKNIVR